MFLSKRFRSLPLFDTRKPRKPYSSILACEMTSDVTFSMKKKQLRSYLFFFFLLFPCYCKTDKYQPQFSMVNTLMLDYRMTQLGCETTSRFYDVILWSIRVENFRQFVKQERISQNHRKRFTFSL